MREFVFIVALLMASVEGATASESWIYKAPHSAIHMLDFTSNGVCKVRIKEAGKWHFMTGKWWKVKNRYFVEYAFNLGRYKNTNEEVRALRTENLLLQGKQLVSEGATLIFRKSKSQEVVGKRREEASKTRIFHLKS